MPIKHPRTPKYRHYKPKNLAVVRINGRDMYLGKYGSPESRERYDRLVAELLLSRQGTLRPITEGSTSSDGLLVNHLILAFWQWAEPRYVKDGKPTSEIRSFRTALKPVRRLYGSESVVSFGPLALVACRKQLIDQGICRKRINQHVSRIRQMFKWGVARELVPETVWRALCAVDGLRFGEAAETKPIKPVPEEHVSLVERYVTPQIWGMINLQLWTGCRPGEACRLRGVDIQMRGDIWEYRPESHKTEHYQKERIIFLGPHARSVIEPWLKSDPNTYLFSPREAKAWYLAQRAKNRKTTPSRRKQSRKRNPKRRPGDYYTTHAYDHAISRACKRTGVPSWAPNQLRHNAATRIRAEFGIEAARIILGHASAVTSEIYADIDRDKAREIMRKLG